MALNQYFNYHEQNGELSNEQTLHNDMLVESIQIHGVDVYYVDKETNNVNELYGEDTTTKFIGAKTIEMFIESFAGFEGVDTLGIMGYTVRDEINLMVAKSRFIEEVGHIPFEGDLIMLPFKDNDNKGILFSIRFVEDEDQFYPLGKNLQYRLKCSLHEHSNEEYDTGNVDIDTMNLDDFGDDKTDLTGQGDNEFIETESDDIIDNAEGNAFGEY